jgi:hypothetical protein
VGRRDVVSHHHVDLIDDTRVLAFDRDLRQAGQIDKGQIRNIRRLDPQYEIYPFSCPGMLRSELNTL